MNNPGKVIDRIVPRYAIIPLISAFTYNCLVYTGTSIMCKNRIHYDFTTDLDRKVPFIEEFVIIYFLAYLFWIVNYILIAKGEKKQFYRFLTADLLSRTICLFFFIVLPTTNVRPELTGDSFYIKLVQFLYDVDQPANLFPSIHCLVSWLCFIGIKKRKDISIWYKGFTCAFAILIFISTQTLKQHYLVDIAGALVIAEFTLWIANRTEWYRWVERFFEKINYRVSTKKTRLGKICEEK